MQNIKQFFSFGIVGLLQYVLDVLLFLYLSKLFGIVILANICSRLFASILGFYLNKNFTFDLKQEHSSTFLFRHIVAWMGMTFISSSMIFIVSFYYEPGTELTIAKGIVEIGLFFVAFIIVRNWVFEERLELTEEER